MALTINSDYIYLSGPIYKEGISPRTNVLYTNSSLEFICEYIKNGIYNGGIHKFVYFSNNVEWPNNGGVPQAIYIIGSIHDIKIDRKELILTVQLSNSNRAQSFRNLCSKEMLEKMRLAVCAAATVETNDNYDLVKKSFVNKEYELFYTDVVID